MKLTAETDHRNPEMRGAETGLRATPISARNLTGPRKPVGTMTQAVPAGGTVGHGTSPRTLKNTLNDYLNYRYTRTKPVTASFFALAVILLSCGTGCSSHTILTSVNNYAYWVERVNEAPTPCRHAKLEKWRQALDEANAASKRGGSFPLQLKALRDAEAKFGECK